MEHLCKFYICLTLELRATILTISVTMMSIFSSWSCLIETYLGRVTLVSVNSYKKMIKVKSIRRKNG